MRDRREHLAHLGFMLCGLAATLQASGFDGVAFDRAGRANEQCVRPGRRFDRVSSREARVIAVRRTRKKFAFSDMIVQYLQVISRRLCCNRAGTRRLEGDRM